MYLTTFRKHGVGPGNWGPAAWGDPDRFTRLLDEADATLNSWKEAHDVFNRWQQDQPKVDTTAFQMMKPLVYRVIGETILNVTSSYDNEAITYALLERWIAVRQAQLRIDRCAT